MRQPVENYISQDLSREVRKQAFRVWSVSLFAAFAWVFLILLAPAAEANNLDSISNPLYNFFSYLCHQIPSRTFHFENHVFAVCSRCFGIYFGLFFGLSVYPFLRPIEKTESFPRFWLFLAMIPMAVDWSLGVFGIWENTHFSRFFTGLILGGTCAIFIVPALVDTFQFLSSKKQIKKLSR